MVSKPVSELLVDLNVHRSHSRPRTSNDNPYSEAQFTTLKYSYDFPDRFGSLADARAFCEGFFTAYNHDHRHSGIGLHTPASVHFGTADQVQAHRQPPSTALTPSIPSGSLAGHGHPASTRDRVDQPANSEPTEQRPTVSFDLTSTGAPLGLKLAIITRSDPGRCPAGLGRRMHTPQSCPVGWADAGRNAMALLRRSAVVPGCECRCRRQSSFHRVLSRS